MEDVRLFLVPFDRQTPEAGVFWESLIVCVLLYTFTWTVVEAKSEKAEASGLETDVDDPRDNIVHDRRELLATHPLCEIGKRCRRKREIDTPGEEDSVSVGSNIFRRRAGIYAAVDKYRRNTERDSSGLNEKSKGRKKSNANGKSNGRRKSIVKRKNDGRRINYVSRKIHGIWRKVGSETHGRNRNDASKNAHSPIRGLWSSNGHFSRKEFFKQARNHFKLLTGLERRLSKRLYKIILLRHSPSAWKANRMIYKIGLKTKKNPDQWFRQSVNEILSLLRDYQNDKAAKLIKIFDKNLIERKQQMKILSNKEKGENKTETETAKGKEHGSENNSTVVESMETTLSRLHSLATKMEQNDKEDAHLMRQEMLRRLRVQQPENREKVGVILKLIAEKKYADARAKIVELLRTKATNPEN